LKKKSYMKLITKKCYYTSEDTVLIVYSVNMPVEGQVIACINVA